MFRFGSRARLCQMKTPYKSRKTSSSHLAISCSLTEAAEARARGRCGGRGRGLHNTVSRDNLRWPRRAWGRRVRAFKAYTPNSHPSPPQSSSRNPSGHWRCCATLLAGNVEPYPLSRNLSTPSTRQCRCHIPRCQHTARYQHMTSVLAPAANC